MEDPAMTAELTKQDAGAVERTDTQRFFALEQLTDQAQTISLFADALPVYREQTGEKLDAEEKAQAVWLCFSISLRQSWIFCRSPSFCAAASI